jgi:hypothetical protein
MMKLIDALLHLVIANSPRINALPWHRNRVAGITYSSIRTRMYKVASLSVKLTFL